MKGKGAFHRSSMLSKLILNSVALPVFLAMATSPSISSKLLASCLIVFIVPPRYVFLKVGRERMDVNIQTRLDAKALDQHDRAGVCHYA